MALFDEAMAAAAGGQSHDLRTLGDVYCATVNAAEVTVDMSRFGRWTDMVTGFLRRHRHPDLFTFCGTCCAEVVGAGGDWREAERWLVQTLRSLEATGQRPRCVHPAARLASLRVRQGRLAEAEHLLEGYEDLPEAVQPMVAVHLARGQPALAAARLHRRLNEIGRNHLLAVPLLVQLVETQLARRDLDGAAQTARRLAAIAEKSRLERVAAEAALATGAVLAAADEPAATIPQRQRPTAVQLDKPVDRGRLPHHQIAAEYSAKQLARLRTVQHIEVQGAYRVISGQRRKPGARGNEDNRSSRGWDECLDMLRRRWVLQQHQAGPVCHQSPIQRLLGLLAVWQMLHRHAKIAQHLGQGARRSPSAPAPVVAEVQVQLPVGEGRSDALRPLHGQCGLLQSLSIWIPRQSALARDAPSSSSAFPLAVTVTVRDLDRSLLHRKHLVGHTSGALSREFGTLAAFGSPKPAGSAPASPGRRKCGYYVRGGRRLSKVEE